MFLFRFRFFDRKQIFVEKWPFFFRKGCEQPLGVYIYRGSKLTILEGPIFIIIRGYKGYIQGDYTPTELCFCRPPIFGTLLVKGTETFSTEEVFFLGERGFLLQQIWFTKNNTGGF